ncbi:MAG: hypothetical protein ACM3JE_02260 [Betaproteobacteria bacterium]
MKIKLFAVAGFFVLLIVSSLFLTQPQTDIAIMSGSDFYFGIDAAYGDPEAIKVLIDDVSAYTNLFIVGCTAISLNQTLLEEICQYLYERDMSFIIYQDSPLGMYDNGHLIPRQTRPLNTSNPSTPTLFPNQTRQPSNYTIPFNMNLVSNWTQTAKNRWGNNFLGFYYIDEVAGRQLDLVEDWIVVNKATDYAEATSKFIRSVGGSVTWYRNGYNDWTNVSLFTSDYALYHFDYKVGYDVVFAQLGWNYSRQLNLALCRGAATTQGKEWGAIVTWEYTEPPYIQSASKLFNDLVLAYENGAKYVVVFDSNKQYTQTILTKEHLDAMKQFWQYTKDHPRNPPPISERTAFVLPPDYAYGFRGPDDKIWGLWQADELSMDLSVNLASKMIEYGEKLDIVYDQPHVGEFGYMNLIYWYS